MRWRVAEWIFFSAAMVGLLAVSAFVDWEADATTVVGVRVEYLLCLGALLLSLLTLRGFRRYPRVSFGRTSIFLFLILAALLLLIARASSLEIGLLPMAIHAAVCASILLVWTSIELFVRHRHFHVIPSPAIERLLEPFDDRYEFSWIESETADGIDQRATDGIVFDPNELTEWWRTFLTQVQLSGVATFPIGVFIESHAGRVALTHLDESTVSALSPSMIYRIVKRAIDILLVLVTLPISASLALAIAFVIRLESRGAVIFRQTRIGEGGKPFVIYKFRSMRLDAEASGPSFAHEDDARVTKIGRFIRQFRLDELPQFFNIVRGEMSLIGPRPEQEVMVERFKNTIPFYSYRHLVKPGITGWAQVTHGYTADRNATEVKLEHDLYYIKHFSAWLDLLIGIKTLKTIVTGFGAR